MVSILIAARNEENNIIRCLQAIDALQFPKTQLEVWVGNDQSEDQTEALVDEFIRDKPHFHLLNITQTVGQTKGKANVLAQLAQQAKGDFYFITDADIQVPPTWLTTMLTDHQPDTGIVTGVTLPTGTRLLHQMQALEWAYTLGIIKQFADWRVPLTTMGNNMMITRKAYEATGGYENLPFSITEDYLLFRETLKKGFGFQQRFQPEVIAWSQPMSSLHALLQQRKRWMYGVMQLPLYLRVVLFADALFLPLLLVLFAAGYTYWATGLGVAKAVFQLLSIATTLRRLRLFRLFTWAWLYPVYHHCILCILLIYYYLPVAVVWKGRRY